MSDVIVVRKQHVSWQAYACLFYMISIATAYVLSAGLLAKAHCPNNSHWKVAQGSTLALIVGVLFLFKVRMARLALVTSGLAGNSKNKNVAGAASWLVRIASSSAMLQVAAGGLWWNFQTYYACVTTTEITWRSGPFSAQQHSTWSNVDSIQAKCGTPARQHHPQAHLTLHLTGTRETILLGLDDSDAMALSRQVTFLRSALPQSAEYYTDTSVTRSRCPPAAYALLTNWAVR